MLRRVVLLIFLSLFSCPHPGAAEEPEPESPGVFECVQKRLGQIWDSPIYDLYVPLYIWHNRLMYDSGKTAKYNENPWGLGAGKALFDEDGDWHNLYAIGFMDSNDHFQPMLGYGFLKNWRPWGEDSFRLGVGYTLGLTARYEYDYIPLPLALPMAGAGYKNFDVQAAYVPGGYNDGNVLFIWLRWQITH